MTEQELREQYVHTAGSYYGTPKGSDKHKEILGLYNGHKPLARGYKMTENDPWCATFTSAMAIKCGLTDIVPVECSCSKLIELATAAGIWVENDAHIPQPGDLMLYDWEDDGTGDCTGAPNHIGIVVRVVDGTIRVIEGNMYGCVWHRDMKTDGKSIRGYICPDFASRADKPSRWKDVPADAWYADAVAYCTEHGLMAGVSETCFGVGQKVTREQLAVVLATLHREFNK